MSLAAQKPSPLCLQDTLNTAISSALKLVGQLNFLPAPQAHKHTACVQISNVEAANTMTFFLTHTSLLPVIVLPSYHCNPSTQAAEHIEYLCSDICSQWSLQRQSKCFPVVLTDVIAMSGAEVNHVGLSHLISTLPEGNGSFDHLWFCKYSHTYCSCM